MPYEYKKSQACRQSDNSKGTYVTKKASEKKQKCWKSKSAHERSVTARHAQEVDEYEDDVLKEIHILRSVIRQYLTK